MKKIAVIDGCDYCPHFDSEYYDYANNCMILKRHMDTNTIPPDCPLEDATLEQVAHDEKFLEE